MPVYTDKKEKELLEKYGDFYRDLDSGKRKPSTKSQEHFVLVCQGLAQPLTVHEIAYIKSKSMPCLSIGERIGKPCTKKIATNDNVPRIKMYDSWFGSGRKKGN